MQLRATRLTAIATAVRKLFTPADLFKFGEQGLWLDPSDFATMFQDAAGTTPVTAVEQPVGLMLDKRLGLIRGPELVTAAPGMGGTWSGLGVGGWSATAGRAEHAAGSYGVLQFVGSVATGRYYLVTLDCTVISSNFNLYVGGTLSGTVNSGGAKTFLIFAGSNTSSVVAIEPATPFIGSVYNISVRELPGNHAYQTTAPARPKTCALVNLLTKTEDFADSAWLNIATTTVASNTFTAPDGSLTADTITATGANSIRWQTYVPVSGNTYTASFYIARKTGSGLVEMTADGSTWVTVALNSALTRFSATYTAVAGTKAIGIRMATAGDEIYAWGSQLDTGSVATRYQRVNTTTDYDTAGFPLYLKFDGIDDFLVTNSIDFTATDKMTVWAGVRKLSDVGYPAILEFSANSNLSNGTFTLGFSNGTNGGLPAYSFSSKGSVTALVASPNLYPAPITNVLTATGDIGNDSAMFKINGLQIGQSTADQGTGNYGNYPIYIGRRGGTSLPFNGNIYQLIIRGAQTSIADIGYGDKFTAIKTGVIL